MFKDLGLAQDAAKRSGSHTPLGTLARGVYSDLMDSGYAKKDFSSVYQYLQDKK